VLLNIGLPVLLPSEDTEDAGLVPQSTIVVLFRLLSVKYETS